MMQLWVANVATGRDNNENEHKQTNEDKEGDDTVDGRNPAAPEMYKTL